MMCFADYFGRALSAVSASQFPWTKLFRESAIGKIADEVLSIYKSLTPKKLAKDSSKVCDVLVLFECLATHPQTKMQFLNVTIHCYLYPFLKTEETGKPFHYLRLMSLGVIGGLLRAGRFPGQPHTVSSRQRNVVFPPNMDVDMVLMVHLGEGFKERRGMILRQRTKGSWLLSDKFHMTGWTSG